MAVADITGQLALKKDIDATADVLLEECERFFNLAGVTDIMQQGDQGEFGNAQLRNLLDAAGEAYSPAELKAYIRYKVGRDAAGSRPRGWARPCGPEHLPLGEELCRAISRVEEIARQAIPNHPEAVMKLVEKFLGYVYWQGSSINAQGRRNRNHGR